ncbi:hypothetical protein HWV62_39800 [Athelia sp. TMB]|nr:hypothetical protein HWV62_39800 [Athelia sp. TMB]
MLLLVPVLLAVTAAARPADPGARHVFAGALADDCTFALGDRAFDMCAAFARLPTESLIAAHSSIELARDSSDVLIHRFYTPAYAQTAEIAWVCAPASSSSPDLIHLRAYTHPHGLRIEYPAPEACALPTLSAFASASDSARKTLPTLKPKNGGGGGENAETGEDDAEKPPTSDLDVPSSAHRRRRAVAAVLFTAIALAALAYLIRRPPPVLTKLLATLPALPHLSLPHLALPHLALPTLSLPALPHRKPRLARAGEGRLVEWAAEDMGLLDYGDGGDEFVNAHGDEAEEVPLARGRGRGLFGGRGRGYGSVRA